MVDLEDRAVYDYISNENNEGVFQLSSNMMSGLIKQIKPSTFNDIVAINAIGRPGPLSANLNIFYAEGKNEGKITETIRGCDDFLNQTFGCIIYQEQLMAVSKYVSGFDDGQADSITRKISAKKKKKLFPMMIRCHIYGKKNCQGPEGWEEDDKAPWYDPEGKLGPEIPGALVNGYSEQEMLDYFDKIEGFCSYAFNLSHAACYAYIAVLTAYLKKNYPAEYMAAFLTMAGEDNFQEGIGICKKLGIKIKTPDINISKEDFTPNGDEILYGLNSVKGVGLTSIPEIIKNAPYLSIEDAIEKIPKKCFNKKVGSGLIKAGAFDNLPEHEDRNGVLNRFYTLRKDKVDLIPHMTTKKEVMDYEEETLGTHITYKTWWEDLPTNKNVALTANIKSVKEKVDKKGNLMAFITLEREDVEFECVVFSSVYCKTVGVFDKNLNTVAKICGKKDEKGSFIVKEAMPATA